MLLLPAWWIKCIPISLHGLEACPLLKSDLSSLGFVVNRLIMKLFKLFKTSNIDVVKCCQDNFGFDLPSVSSSKRVKKCEAKFHACSNLLCNVLWTCRERAAKTVNCCIYSYFVELSLVKFCFLYSFCYHILWWNKAVQWKKWTEGSGGTTLLLYFAFALVHDSRGMKL